MSEAKLDFMATLKKLRSGTMRVADLPETAIERLTEMMGSDRDALQARYDQALERERRAPKPGDRAPRFELELLGADGARTGKLCELPARPEKPVALVFGSYT